MPPARLPRGMPSRRRHISTISVVVVCRGYGSTNRAKHARRTALRQWSRRQAMERSAAARRADAGLHGWWPGSSTVEDWLRIVSVMSAAASRRCSQLSNTSEPVPAVLCGGDAIGQALSRLLADAEHCRDRLGYRAGSPTGASSIIQTPSENSFAQLAKRPRRASRVLLDTARHRSTSPTGAPSAPSAASAISASADDSIVSGGRRFPGVVSSVLQRREFACAARQRMNLKYFDSASTISRSRREPRGSTCDAAEQCRGGAIEQDLAAVPCRHHPRCPVQHRAEVVIAAHARPHPSRYPSAPAVPAPAGRRRRRRLPIEATRTPRTPHRRCA